MRICKSLSFAGRFVTFFSNKNLKILCKIDKFIKSFEAPIAANKPRKCAKSVFFPLFSLGQWGEL